MRTIAPQADLFGNVQAPPPPEKKKRGPGRRQRLTEFLKDHKFESFTTLQLLAMFSKDEHDAVRKHIATMKRDGELVATGACRGVGLDNQCMKLNPHRRC